MLFSSSCKFTNRPGSKTANCAFVSPAKRALAASKPGSSTLGSLTSSLLSSRAPCRPSVGIRFEHHVFGHDDIASKAGAHGDGRLDIDLALHHRLADGVDLAGGAVSGRLR